MIAKDTPPAITPAQLPDPVATNPPTPSIRSPSTNTNIKIHIYSAEDLKHASPQFPLHNLNNLINDAFSAHGHPDSADNQVSNALFTGKRIQSPDQLIHELGAEGLIAICMDENLPDVMNDSNDNDYNNNVTNEQHDSSKQYVPGKYGKIAATACLKPWKGRAVDVFRGRQQTSCFEGKDVSQGKFWDWEVSTCASVNYARYRGQGLMIRCVDALVHRVEMMKNDLKGSGDPRADLLIKLWSTSLMGSGNTEYWTRRGFVLEGEDIATKGMWTSTKDFKIQTLGKIIR